jgi:hypothetical protein
MDDDPSTLTIVALAHSTTHTERLISFMGGVESSHLLFAGNGDRAIQNAILLRSLFSLRSLLGVRTRYVFICPYADVQATLGHISRDGALKDFTDTEENGAGRLDGAIVQGASADDLELSGLRNSLLIYFREVYVVPGASFDAVIAAIQATV